MSGWNLILWCLTVHKTNFINFHRDRKLLPDYEYTNAKQWMEFSVRLAVLNYIFISVGSQVSRFILNSLPYSCVPAGEPGPSIFVFGQEKPTIWRAKHQEMAQRLHFIKWLWTNLLLCHRILFSNTYLCTDEHAFRCLNLFI